MRAARALALGLATALVASAAWAHGPTVNGSFSAIRPRQLAIRAGDTVHFRNANSSEMTMTFVADDESGFASPEIPRGGGWHYKFETPGVYRIRLKENSDTKVKIVVGEPSPGER
jgi:plastocyanin